MKKIILLLTFIAAFSVVNAQIYVDIDVAPNGNGSSWTNAYNNLQDAIDAAVKDQEIWVAAGTYYPTKDHTGNTSPTDNRNKNFQLGTDMKIYGGFASGETQLSARDAVANITILSGDFNNDDTVTGSGSTLSFSNNTENAYHVILTANLTSASFIAGFTIKGGNADGLSHISYQSKRFWKTLGGGMANSSSSPTITNSTFANNYADGYGGGMSNGSSSPTITNSTFTNNKANRDGGGMYNYNSSSPTITNSIIWNNGSSEVVNDNSSTPTFKNSIIKDSGGSNAWGAAYGTDNGANLDTDPLFVDAANGDYTLQICSPAIDAGDNGAWTTTGLSTDLAGNTRPFNSGTVDMGAYEYQGTPIAISITAPTVTQPTCAVPTRGEIVVNATTTLGTLEYSVDNGSTYQASHTFSGLSAGSYTIKVQEQGSSCTETYGSNPVVIHIRIYVNKTATGGNNTGTSWADAFTDLQDAIDVNCSNVGIWVAAGTYYPTKDHTGNTSPTDNRDKNFHLGTDMKIYGGFAGGETQLSTRNAAANSTILSGDIDNATDPDAVSGGGSTLSITGNAKNAYHVMITADLTAASFIDGFTIKGGNANSKNYVSYQGEKFYRNFGGGMYNSGSSPSITNSTFANNNSIYEGGGMVNKSSSPKITNSTFTKNNGFGGGGMHNESSSPSITNSTFANNNADYGGGMYNASSSPTITNSTLTNNNAVQYGGGMNNYDSSSPTITNSIIWNNGNSEVANANSSTPTFKKSIIKDSDVNGSWNTAYGTDSGANLDIDPLFVDAVNGDYTLQICSPAIDAGDNGAWITTGLSTDIAGNIRPFNSTVDMGAYEYQGDRIAYVNKMATGNNNGTSWTDAFTDLQDAIDVNCSNVDIWVAVGTYYPTKDHTGNTSPSDNRDKNFHLHTDMKIYGGFAGTETQLSARNAAANITILSGDFNNDDTVTGSGSTLSFSNNTENAYHVILTANLTSASFIAGFTIKGGNADGLSHISYQSKRFWKTLGGGMANSSSSPTITNSTFANNYADGYGGGMSNGSSSPTITNSTFTNNKANRDGGGMSNGSSSPTITNTTFTNNDADEDGGGMYNYYLSSPTITNSTFTNNNSDYGGGMYNGSFSSPTITNSTFTNNKAEYGGGMYNSYFSSPTITNSTFTNNKANRDGGGMNNYDSSSPTITNSTFANNNANRDGGGINNNSSSPTITNSIIWNNGSSEVVNDNSSTPTFKNSIIKDSDVSGSWNTAYGTDNGANLDTNPLFVDAANGDYTLQICSPAIDAGDNTAWTTTGLSTDIAGNTRPFNSTVDIGAYEYQGIPIAISITVPTVTQPTCAVPTGGEIVVSATTTLGTLEYSVDNGSTYQASNTFSGLSIGNYTIKVQEQGSSCTETYSSNPVVINALVSYTKIYVNKTATGGNNNGTSWVDAFTNLQDAIGANCSNVDIWVAAGTYYPTASPDGTTTDSRNKAFHLGTDMKIYGGFAGGETQLSARNAAANITILSGDFNNDDIVTGGGSALSFSNNTENAYHIIITADLTAAAVIDGFTIKGGNADGSNTITYQANSFNRSFGGGMLNVSSSPTITNSTFANNKASDFGGGMFNTSSSPTITNSTFVNNKAASDGGGVLNFSSSPTITNSTFANNYANLGGGMLNSFSSPTITNSTFANNYAADEGGGINNNSSSPTITNSIIWNNGSNEVANDNNSTPTFKNSIIKDSDVSGSWNTAYGTDNGANLDTNPLFVDAANGDYTLQICSPAIDAGDNTAWTTTGLSTDIAGNTRPFNSTVDIGAYEYQGIPIAISITVPTVTQPTCAVPTGTIVVNATTTSGTLEYSIDNGSRYQASATFSGLSGGSYTIIVREQGSSCTETYGSNPVAIDTLLLTYELIPSISVSQTELCLGESMTLSATNIPNSVDGLTIHWTGNYTGQTITVSPSTNSDFRVAVQSANGCLSDSSDVVSITVNQLPSNPVITSNNVSLCTGETVTLSGSCETNTVFSWITPVENTNGATTSALSNSNQRVINAAGTYTGYCETTTGCRSGEVSIVITESTDCGSEQVIAISPAKPTICPGEIISLTASGCTGTLTWSGGPVGLASQIGSTASFNPVIATTYSVTCSTGGSGTVDVSIVKANEVISSDISTGTSQVRALETIQSDKKIGDTNVTPAPNVIFQSGKSILLSPGFEVTTESIFKAQIQGPCANTSITSNAQFQIRLPKELIK